MNVMIVDDDPAAREELVRQLRNLVGDVSISEFGNVRAALKAAWRAAYDVVFLEVELVGESGLGLVDRLRYVPAPADIVLMSRHNGFATEAFDLCVAGFLKKPANSHVLAQILARICDRMAVTQN